MLGLDIGLGAGSGPLGDRGTTALTPPPGLGWNADLAPLAVMGRGRDARSGLAPRSLVDPAIWTGAAIHVDGQAGDDLYSGLGAADGDFSAAKRTIHAAFTAGNATGAAYRVIVKSGRYQESSFTKNGNVEPDQPVAILGWGGPVKYRTGPWAQAWTVFEGTYRASVSAVRRVFRTDVPTPAGLYLELAEVATVADCAATPDSWTVEGGRVHVNIGRAPGLNDIALIRSFHGARFMTHNSDLYLENIHTEGGITGALHCDPQSARNIVGVNCSFRYSAPSVPSAPQDAVRIRQVTGLCAFFDSDASGGAKDGWSFHDDGTPGMHALLERCTGFGNGWGEATSCNGFTTHDSVRGVALSGSFGQSRNGAEVHCIQDTRTWMVGCDAVARDIDGSSVAYKCSHSARMWLDRCRGDAAGPGDAFVIEANGGHVSLRAFTAVAGAVSITSGGIVDTY